MNTVRNALSYVLTLVATGAQKAADWVKPTAVAQGGGGKGEER